MLRWLHEYVTPLPEKKYEFWAVMLWKQYVHLNRFAEIKYLLPTGWNRLGISAV